MMNRWLDGSRVVAALCIFYYHVGIFVPLPLAAEGEYAVSAFIVLAMASAIAFSLPKREGVLKPGAYLLDKVVRLMPIYWAVNAAGFAASFAVPSKLGRPFTVSELLLSCLGLSEYVRERYISEVFWFIPFILQMYVLIALLAPHLARVRWAWSLPLAFAVMAIGIEGTLRLRPDSVEIVRNWSPLLRLPDVCLGAIVGRWIAGQVSGAELARLVAYYAVLAAGFAGGAWGGGGVRAYLYLLPLQGLAVTLAIMGLAWAVTRGFAAARDAAAWRLLGRATYPFYLIHGLGVAFVFHRGGASALVWLSYLAGCVAAAVALDQAFARLPLLWRRPADRAMG